MFIKMVHISVYKCVFKSSSLTEVHLSVILRFYKANDVHYHVQKFIYKSSKSIMLKIV